MHSGESGNEKYTEKTTDMNCKVALSHLKTKLASLQSQLNTAIPGNKCACFVNPGDEVRISASFNYGWEGTDCNPTNDGLPKVSDFDKASCQDTPNKQSNTTSAGNPPQAVGSVRSTYKTLPNPLGPTSMTIGSVPKIVGKVINAILTILGSIALLVIIYGGFTWMTSAGNDNRVAQGKSTLMWAAIALGIIFLAWMLEAFLFQALGV